MRETESNSSSLFLKGLIRRGVARGKRWSGVRRHEMQVPEFLPDDQ